MRRYIRHPAAILIEFQLEDTVEVNEDVLQDISIGGLCLQSSHNVKKNSLITIHIPDIQPDFKGQGIVVWCHPNNENTYDIGIKFLDHQTAFRVRMVEQVCHIEAYQKYIMQTEGRTLDSREAALEWIGKYARDFPTAYDLKL